MTGVVDIAHGGTGATTQADAANAILPPQSGHGGKFLMTDGANVSWGMPPGGGGGSITIDKVTYDTPGTYIWSKPAGAEWIRVDCWGGGGGGGRGSRAGCGGGGGAYISAWLPSSQLPSTVTVTVGNGGAGMSSSGNGGNGEASSFGTYLVAPGGTGGGFTNSFTSCSGGAGGTPSEPENALVIWKDNGGGGAGITMNQDYWVCGPGGNGNIFGGSGGGPMGTNHSCAGGTSFYGGNGGSSSSRDGGVPGGGGAGAASGTSGAGGMGRCKVTTIIRN